MLLHVTKIYYMLSSVVEFYLELCICCAVLLHGTKSYYMLCGVVTCYQELLHVVQCCYVLSRVIT